MDELRDFLEAVKSSGVAAGHLRGLLHLLVGRRLCRLDGAQVSAGVSWRVAAAQLKLVRWDRDAVRELGIDPSELAPRDREKYWYIAITRADLGSAAAREDATKLAALLGELGYAVEG